MSEDPGRDDRASPPPQGSPRSRSPARKSTLASPSGSSNLNEQPRSILRRASSSSTTRIAPRIDNRARARRRRRRRLHFSTFDQVFFIPNRLQLKEEQRRAMRERRLRRRLTMRSRGRQSPIRRYKRLRALNRRRRRIGSRLRSSQSQRRSVPRRRVNRLARARRRYLGSRRRRRSANRRNTSESASSFDAGNDSQMSTSQEQADNEPAPITRKIARQSLRTQTTVKRLRRRRMRSPPLDNENLDMD